jgi:small-conductance mechanosensitive channel
MSSKRSDSGWKWWFAGGLADLLVQATGLTIPFIFAGAIAFLLWPFVWLACYWRPTSTNHADPGLNRPGHLDAGQGAAGTGGQSAAHTASGRQRIARMAVSLFFAIWAMFFATLTILLFAATMVAIFRVDPGYGTATLAGCVCVICGWFAYQIGSAIRA